jgi:hypothetical protein
MPVIAVTRLRLRDPALLDEFFTDAVAAIEQASPALPEWQTSWHRLTVDGQAADLTHPSPANQTRDFPPPVEPPPGVS